MFVRAVEKAGQFTRPVCFVGRNYGSTTPIPGAATYFFVNDQGWVLTCKHVAGMIRRSQEIAGGYQQFKRDLAALGTEPSAESVAALESRYGLFPGVTVELLAQLVLSTKGKCELLIIDHPTYDISLMHLQGDLFPCKNYPSFAADGAQLQPGRTLVRLGFPFPEFTAYEYDPVSDSIQWTQTGNQSTPRFPIEGMVTRGIMDLHGVFGFEMSTPGIKGQSGGPAFDVEGRIWGIQSSTNHLDLDFDINQPIRRGDQFKHVQDSAFLHVGNCVHVNVIKEFMRQHRVPFQLG